MIGKDHHYSATLRWTGNRGTGTSGYRDYDRSYTLAANGKAELEGSSDPTFRGDAAKWNPEEMLLSALSSCHMLSYLHQCADAGITVLEYTDDMSGTMELDRDGAGRFTGVTLRPRVLLADTADLKLAESLHHVAHEKCFIANSVNFPVRCEAVVLPVARTLQEA
ncbi:MAG: OsmC family protein [Janthinobacterium lividum]